MISACPTQYFTPTLSPELYRIRGDYRRFQATLLSGAIHPTRPMIMQTMGKAVAEEGGEGGIGTRYLPGALNSSQPLDRKRNCSPYRSKPFLHT